jgi:hypothetical protein
MEGIPKPKLKGVRAVEARQKTGRDQTAKSAGESVQLGSELKTVEKTLRTHIEFFDRQRRELTRLLEDVLEDDKRVTTSINAMQKKEKQFEEKMQALLQEENGLSAERRHVNVSINLLNHKIRDLRKRIRQSTMARSILEESGVNLNKLEREEVELLPPLPPPTIGLVPKG